jgi:hypothetical protein
VLDGVGDRLAHRQLHVVAGPVLETEVPRGALGELACPLQQPQIGAQEVLLWLELRHCPLLVPQHR